VSAFGYGGTSSRAFFFGRALVVFSLCSGGRGQVILAQIELRDICKTFSVSVRPEGRFGVLRGALFRHKKIIKALDGITFDIEAGELVGYIGPNGAGKSTTVKIMSGILTPEEGTCRIMDRIPWRERVGHVSRIGVVFGQRTQLWWDLPVRDSFDLLKDIYSIHPADYTKRLQELTESLDMGPLLTTPVRQLSLGQRMRCEIAAALLHRPDILFLDEPTIGLDAVSKLALRSFLKRENHEKGITMILTTHDMDDVESLCNRVMVIGHGKLLFDGQLQRLKQRYAPLRSIRAVLAEPVEMFHIDGAESIQVEGNVWTVLFDPQKVGAHIMVERLAHSVPLRDVEIREQDIDEIIATMYKEICI
jgi:ABC-2 type transport system ATP-binding protein